MIPWDSMFLKKNKVRNKGNLCLLINVHNWKFSWILSHRMIECSTMKELRLVNSNSFIYRWRNSVLEKWHDSFRDIFNQVEMKICNFWFPGSVFFHSSKAFLFLRFWVNVSVSRNIIQTQISSDFKRQKSRRDTHLKGEWQGMNI